MSPQAFATHLTPATWENGLCATQEQPGVVAYRTVPCRARRSPDIV
jgi:hypothetical protein